MGNHLFISQEVTSKSKICNLLKSKLQINYKTKTGAKSIDDFIIKHLQNNTNNDTKIDIDSFDQRRIVFISLIGLYKTWKNVPSVLLYSSLLCMPLNQEWIYNTTQHLFQLSIFTGLYIDVVEMNEFIEFLKWKDSQELVMWMLDDDISTTQIHSFWYNLSNKLEDLYDPVTQCKYKPINFDIKWLQHKENKLSILNELYCLTMQYNTMKAIISESNPISLRPLTSYLNNIDGDKVSNISMNKLTNLQLLRLYGDQDVNVNITVDATQKEGVWFIAEDY